MRSVSLLNITELDSVNINDDLNISIQNMRGKKPHLFYISDDVNSNQLLLTITNNTEKEFVIKSGAPIAEDPSAVTKLGYSAFWLLFESFLSDTEIKQLTLDDQSKNNWQTMLFENKKSGSDFSPSYICITAKHDITLKNGDSEKIVFIPFKIGDNYNGNGSGMLQVDYFVPTVNPTPQFIDLPVTISQLPSTNKKDSPLSLIVDGSNTLYISSEKKYEISDKIKLVIANTTTEDTLAFSSPEKPNLRIAVIKGDNRSALTNNIGNMECKTEDNGVVVLPASTFDGWNISNVAKINPADSIYFEMDNIVTYLEEGITLIYLSYSNINGYNDGYIVLPLIKKIPPATILNFDVKVIPAEKDHHSLNSQQQCANWGDSIQLSFIVCEVDSVELLVTYYYYKDGSPKTKYQALNTITTIEKGHLYPHQLTNKKPYEFTKAIKDIVPTDYSNIAALEFGIRAYKDNISIPEVTVPKLAINSAKINSFSHKIVPVWDTQNPPNLSGSLTLTWDIEGVDKCQIILPEGCSWNDKKHGETIPLSRKDSLKDIKVSDPYTPSFKIEGLRNNNVVISQIIDVDKKEVTPDGKINEFDGHIDINIPHGPSAYGTVNYHTTGVKTCYIAAIDLEGSQKKEVIPVEGVNGYVEINSDNFFYNTKGMKFTLLCIANNGWPIQQEATVMYTDHNQ